MQSSDYGDIRVGSRVTIVDQFGKERSGRAVMLGLAGWVLNMGGRHGTPAVATVTNFVRVSGGGGYAPSGGWMGSGREAAGAREARRANYDRFTQAYLEAALWADARGEDGEVVEGLGISDISPATRDEMIKDAENFEESEAALLEEAYAKRGYDASKAGFDFWLTRNRHGAGFWDRGLGEVGDKLTKAAHAYGSYDLMVGDDGMVHNGLASARRGENGAREGVPVIYEAAEDFPKLPAAIKGAHAQGFTHHYYEGEKAYVVKPAEKPETGYVRRVVYHRKGKWHIAGGPIDYTHDRLDKLPANARPIPADGEEAAEDYIAVDNKGKKVGGPYPNYEDAKKEAERAGGYVQYAFDGRRAEAPRAREARGDIDEHALEELDLYIENTSELYPQKQAIIKNLELKIKRGTYDPKLAPKLWCYWVEQGAKAYAKEFLASPKEWSRVFPKPLRDKLCERIAEREYAEIMIQMGRSSKPERTAVRAVSEARDVASYATVSRDTKQLDAGRKLGAIEGHADVYALLHAKLKSEPQEVFLVLPLDLHGKLLSPPVEVARGQRDRVVVDNADVFAPVAPTRCKGIIVCHNHPSGDPTPSPADKRLTEQLRKGLAEAYPSVAFVDHCVIGDGRYYSFTEGKEFKG